MSWYKNLKVKSKLLLGFMLILTISVSAGAFSLIEIQGIDNSYASSMEITGRRVEYIIKSNFHFSEARRLFRQVFYPDITKNSLNELANSIDTEIDAMNKELNSLSNTASPAVQEKVKEILPLVERYRTDMQGIIRNLLAIEDVSINNADFIEASVIAKNRLDEIDSSYLGGMIVNVNGLPELAIGAIENLTAANQHKTNRDMIIMIAVYIVMIAGTLSVAFYISSLIGKPLARLSTFMKRVGSTGDIKLTPKEARHIDRMSRIGDETGQTAQGVSALLDHITNTSEKLERIADGDLTVIIEPLSDADTVGNAMLHMVNNLNNMFGEIQLSTGHVSDSSKQIADGAQMLAQGSTQQAAAIQQLSSSIADIKEKTKKNAETADKTSKLSVEIKENAEKGNRQMGDMIVAVKDINDASQSISKIIKTIDDIAFQTNILALNAAVEAARAGQHGKGFAVVAEEVRSLAAKSAEAAKETGNMIQNSMKKAEFGSNIASETAASLADIVTGINESSQLVAEIAKASEEQTAGISEVNIGIEQVAHVVNQNSATAEESAAASQEMSNQSDILSDLIAQFQLKSDKSAAKGLCVYEESGTKQTDESETKYSVHIPAAKMGISNKYGI